MINAGLGLPTEYFRDQTLSILSARWGVAPNDDDGYIDELEARRTTDNGVFAAKIQWHQLDAHPRVRQRLLERADLLVLLFRHDLLAQAVSWQVAIATGYWSFDATPGPKDATADLSDVKKSLGRAAELYRQNQAWARLLTGMPGKLFTVPYKSFVNDQGELIRLIAGGLDLPADAWTLPPPEGRDNRLPDDVEAARARLLAQVREAAALAAASAGR
jgi:LPS sulfotransferase NodH